MGGKDGGPGSPGGCAEAGEGLWGPQRGRLPLRRLVSRCTRSQGENTPGSEPQALSSRHLAGVGSAPGRSLAGHALCAPTHRHPGYRAAGQRPAHPGSPSPQPRLRPHTLRASLCRDPGLGDTEGRTWLGARAAGAKAGWRERQAGRVGGPGGGRWPGPPPSTTLLDTSIRCAPRAAGGKQRSPGEPAGCCHGAAPSCLCV